VGGFLAVATVGTPGTTAEQGVHVHYCERRARRLVDLGYLERGRNGRPALTAAGREVVDVEAWQLPRPGSIHAQPHEFVTPC
jgi:hypothetical protein